MVSVLPIPEAWDLAWALGSQGSVNMAVVGWVDGSLDLQEY